VDREIEEMLAGIEARNARAMEVQRAVERMEITGYAGHGDVTVRLRGTGEFTEVAVDPRLLRRADPDTVSALLVEAVNDGLRRLREASQREFAPLIAEVEGSTP
jgi:nucleoid-associated protein EbfC